jgi:sugar/nucleoside kinase (ribokinase family)
LSGEPRGLFVGLCTLDVVHRVSTLPGPDEKVTALGQDVAAGGPATGAALTFAALGGAATLLTGIGGHLLGDVVRAELEAHGVRVVDLSSSAAPPAVSAVRVLAGTGERSVSSADAAESRLAAPADFADQAAAADVVLYDGHHPALGAAVRRVAQVGAVPVLLDAGRWRPSFAGLLGVPFVVASAAFTLEGRAPSARELVGQGAAAAAVTHGAQPIDWATAGAAEGRLAVEAVPAANTLGAGDAFHGAAAFAVAARGAEYAQRRWPDLLGFAARVAGVRVAAVGPREWLDDDRLAQEVRRWTV